MIVNLGAHAPTDQESLSNTPRRRRSESLGHPSKSNRTSATYLPVWMYLALYRLAKLAMMLETPMFSYNFYTECPPALLIMLYSALCCDVLTAFARTSFRYVSPRKWSSIPPRWRFSVFFYNSDCVEVYGCLRWTATASSGCSSSGERCAFYKYLR